MVIPYFITHMAINITYYAFEIVDAKVEKEDLKNNGIHYFHISLPILFLKLVVFHYLID